MTYEYVEAKSMGQSNCVKPKSGDEKKTIEAQSSHVESEVELAKAFKEEREKSESYLKRLKYLQADFENYRKRMEKTLIEVVRMSKEKVISGLLGAFDELELAVRVGNETENKQALIEGVEMTLKKMQAALTQEGLVRIEALGEAFNPDLHEVAEKVPTDKYDENTIVEEVRTGYMLGDKVIRPSVVKIATKGGNIEQDGD